MPWTKDSPPKCAKNWSDEEKEKCVSAANAVLREGGSEQDAIFACIRNAGKTVHPGGKGKGSLGPAELVELMDQLGEMGLGIETMDVQSAEFEVVFDDDRMVALGAAVSPDVDFNKVRALYFRNGILARQESNRNKDHLPEEEVDNLARTIGGMPIDDEHQFQDIIGCFTKGSVVEENGRLAVATDGIIWAQRFPGVAREIAEGKRKLSMEVWIGQATCSMCDETFSNKENYCAHLKHREADRILHNVVGFGGAATIKPAGSETLFDADRMMIVASAHGGDEGSSASEEFDLVVDVMDDADYLPIMAVIGGWVDEEDLGLAKKLEYKERESLSDKNFALIQTKKNERTGKTVKVRRFPIHDCSHAANALSRLPQAKNLSSSERASVKRKAQAKLASPACKGWRGKMKGKGNMAMTEEELQARVTELEGELAGKVQELEGAQAELATAQESLATSEQAQADLRWSIRAQTLAQAGFDEDELEKQKEVLAAMPDEAFDLLVAALKKPAAAVGTALGSVELGTGGDGAGTGDEEYVLDLSMPDQP